MNTVVLIDMDKSTTAIAPGMDEILRCEARTLHAGRRGPASLPDAVERPGSRAPLDPTNFQCSRQQTQDFEQHRAPRPDRAAHIGEAMGHAIS
jgi:hypothetical protein